MANGITAPDFTGKTLLGVARSYDDRIDETLLTNGAVERSRFSDNPRTEIELLIADLEARKEPLNFIKNHTKENRLVGKILAHCFRHACAPFLHDPEKPITSDNISIVAGDTNQLLKKFGDTRAFAASQALRILAEIPAIKNMDQTTRTCFLREFDAKCQTGLIEVLKLLIDISHDRRAEDRKQNAAIISPTNAFFAGELMRKRNAAGKKSEDGKQHPTSTALAGRLGFPSLPGDVLTITSPTHKIFSDNSEKLGGHGEYSELQALLVNREGYPIAAWSQYLQSLDVAGAPQEVPTKADFVERFYPDWEKNKKAQSEGDTPTSTTPATDQESPPSSGGGSSETAFLARFGEGMQY